MNGRYALSAQRRLHHRAAQMVTRGALTSNGRGAASTGSQLLCHWPATRCAKGGVPVGADTSRRRARALPRKLRRHSNLRLSVIHTPTPLPANPHERYCFKIANPRLPLARATTTFGNTPNEADVFTYDNSCLQPMHV